MTRNRLGNLTERQAELIETNIRWLRQALDMVGSLDDRAFTTSPKGMAPHRVSDHLLHIVELYDCFLDGVESTHIDYDARKRDENLERSRVAAADKILSIIRRLEITHDLFGDAMVFVRMEDADAGRFQDPFLLSSVSRELQVLSSHTIHHFALIAMTLRLHGCEVDQHFGMAPSTLRFQSQKQTGAAEAA